MTCSAGDLLTGREAARPAACSLEATRIKHKSPVPTGRWEAPSRVNVLRSPPLQGTPSRWFVEKKRDWGSGDGKFIWLHHRLARSLGQVALPFCALVPNPLK